MKTVKNYVFGMMFLLIPVFGAFAQSPNPTIYQNWQALPDSPSHLEVAWSTCKCSATSSDEIRLSVFNESGDDQTANFTLTISDQGQSDVTYSVSNLNLTGGQTFHADCGNNGNEDLSTNVPAGFDPNTLTITITYN